jgi:S-adenosylmethionine synthetase
MRNILIEELKTTPVEKQLVELVERKGIGHPDSICDAIMEKVSVNLCKEYKNVFGKIVHHNIDKALLVAGKSSPKIGGGTVDEPMRLVFGDRAIYEYKGRKIPVGEIAKETAKSWFRKNLRFIDPKKHVIYQVEIKPGSQELIDIFDRKPIVANDTSASVGYAPLTETEKIVINIEKHLNSKEFKEKFPECGEDIKVMAYRQKRNLTLTIAMAFVDRFIDSEKKYFSQKKEIRSAIFDFISKNDLNFDRVNIDINTLDKPGRGEKGMYLTVLGTSADGGDCGQVGRGNRVNGVIALNRPMSTEAAAGKNPVSHVGKIYNVLSHEIAKKVYKKIPNINEVYIWLCSQIGKPIDEPLIASAHLILKPGSNIKDIKSNIEEVIENELKNIYKFTDELSRGKYPIW